MVRRQCPQDNLIGFGIVKDAAPEIPTNPTPTKKMVKPEYSTPKGSTADGEWQPIFHKHMGKPITATPRTTRRKVISDEDHVKHINSSFTSQQRMFATGGITGSARRRAESAQPRGRETPFATGDLPAQETLRGRWEHETPKQGVKPVKSSWTEGNGNVTAIMCSPMMSPEQRREVRGRRATSVGATLRDTPQSARVYDYSTLRKKRPISAPGSEGRDNTVPVFQQTAEKLVHRPMVRQRENIKGQGLNYLPERKVLKRYESNSKFQGQASAACVDPSKPAVPDPADRRGRMQVSGRGASVESRATQPAKAEVPRTSLRQISEPFRREASGGKRQYVDSKNSQLRGGALS